ncbi:MAG: hypothetical protein JXB30_19020 [Anaerolineae bacterium]|nr:hypothetical protein [Anaerolineae bacterium]
MHRTFISMSWTPGVAAEEAQILLHVIEDIYTTLRPRFGVPGQFDPLPVVRVFGAWTIPSIPQDAAYANVEWYIANSMDDTHQSILASRYLETIILEPWQATNPHFDLALTDLPIIDDVSSQPPALHALGMSKPGILSLISSHPFKSIDNSELHELALRHIYSHYFGRLLDVPRANRSDDTLEHRGGLYCTNTCALRFTDTPTLALSFAQQEMANGQIFCEACQKDLVAQIAGFHFGAN